MFPARLEPEALASFIKRALNTGLQAAASKEIIGSYEGHVFNTYVVMDMQCTACVWYSSR